MFSSRRTRRPDAKRADAVLVMQPGATGSAYSLDRVARNTLHDLAKQGKHAEWWSIARRGICQQDDTGIEAAVAAKDYHVAVDYYYQHKTIDGRQFSGFRGLWGDPMDADFGLAQTVLDENELLTRELPDRQFRATKTLCGGHSLGGLITGIFGAWDFTGNPADAGFRQCAGWVAIDTLVTADPVGLKADPILNALSTVATAIPYAATSSFLRWGLLPADNALIPFFNPKSFNTLAIAGVAARFQPDQETDLNRILPQDWQVASTLRLTSAPTYLDAITGANGFNSFRYTNQAYLGELIGTNSMVAGLDQVPLGTLVGGPVAEKFFPLPGDAAKIPVLGTLLGIAVGHDKRVAPTDHSALYRWADYRHTPTTFYTDTWRQVVDIDDLARTLTGPLGFTETYFPNRVLYDSILALTGTRTFDLAPIRYNAEVMAKLMLTLNGDDSVVKDMLDVRDVAGKLLPAPDINRVMIPGFTHIGMIEGAEVQNDGRPDPVGLAIADFTRKTAH